MVVMDHRNLILKLNQREVEMAHEARELKAQIKAMQDRLEVLDDYFEQKMLKSGAEIATFRNAPVVRLSPYSRTTLDSRRLRLEHPALADAYMVPHTGVTPYYV